jgi:hypothetical protein
VTSSRVLIPARPHRWSGRVTLAIASAVIFAATTTSATAATKPKPWQWTTAQASAAIRVQGNAIWIDPERSLTAALKSVTCRGTSKRVAGRFVAFRCPAIFDGRGTLAFPRPDPRVIIIAKTRRAGGLCWSTTSLVPSGCLTGGTRAQGSVAEAFRAMVQVVGTLNHDFNCLSNGAGFYTCSWMTAQVVHRGTVVFTPNPIVKVLV